MVKKLLLDPGHGGKDPGAVGYGLVEKEYAYLLAYKVKEKLVGYKSKLQVVVIQPSETKPTIQGIAELNEVVKRVNTIGGDLLLSLHLNAGKGTGFESYVQPSQIGKESDRIRKVVHKQFNQFAVKYNLRDRGMKSKNLMVLRETEKKIPGMLFEVAFIDNPFDVKLLKNENFFNGAANEIAYGLLLALGIVK